MFRLTKGLLAPVCLIVVAAIAACSEDQAVDHEGANSPADNDVIGTFTEDERSALVADPTLIERGRRLFSNCAVCHSVDADVNSPAGPHLEGILGRKIASVNDYPYTKALSTVNGNWTIERFDQFITNPMATYPGTSMAFGGVTDAGNRKAIMAYLASTSTD